MNGRWNAPILIATLAAGACGSPGRDLEGRPKVTLLVHDYSGLSPSSLEAIADQVRLVFAHAGVDLQWIPCSETDSRRPAQCEAEAGPRRFTLRILAQYPKGWKRRGDPLGAAQIASFYATLYAGEIRTNAAGKNVDATTLMAYAAIHEILHLLLGPSHSGRGIMRGSWDKSLCSDMAHRRLVLSPAERDSVGRALRTAAPRESAHNGVESP